MDVVADDLGGGFEVRPSLPLSGGGCEMGLGAGWDVSDIRRAVVRGRFSTRVVDAPGGPGRRAPRCRLACTGGTSKRFISAHFTGSSRLRFLEVRDDIKCDVGRCSTSMSATIGPTDRKLSPRREKKAARADMVLTSATGRVLKGISLKLGIDMTPAPEEVKQMVLFGSFIIASATSSVRLTV